MSAKRGLGGHSPEPAVQLSKESHPESLEEPKGNLVFFVVENNMCILVMAVLVNKYRASALVALYCTIHF